MFYSRESELVSNQKTIESFWQNKVQQKILPTSGANLAFAYVIPEQVKYTIVVSSGRIECLLKYKELIWEFYNNNIAVFILDHRGQGLSERTLKNAHIGHIKDFSQYSTDFNRFNLQVVDKYSKGKKILLAHSMGSAIAHNYLNEYKHSFEKAIFCAPMFGINTGNIPLWLAKFLAVSLHKLGFGERYAPGQSNYQAKDFNDNEGQLNTLHISVLPWLNFTSFKHATHLPNELGIPKLVFGEYDKNSGMMSLSIEVHHALMDGIHVAKFVKLLQSYFNEPNLNLGLNNLRD